MINHKLEIYISNMNLQDELPIEIFIKALNALSRVPNNQVENIVAIAKLQTLKKGASFIKQGEIPRKFAFTIRGLFRYYYMNEKGNEYTRGFFPENTFVSSYSAMSNGRESYFTIEALEDSSFFMINYSDWKELLKQDTCWNYLSMALLEKWFNVKESREREFLLHDAETRYHTFLEVFPGLDKRIKQRYIASYLGITPGALNRIRKEM
jgi:CRP-like cAMP-binding protein